jgi:hypothetical protein
MVLGNGAEVIMQVKWWLPRSARFDPARWVRKRLRIVGEPMADGLQPVGVEPLAYVPAEANPRRSTCSLWYGYAPACRLVIEVAFESAKHGSNQKPRRVLESLTVQSPDAPTTWAVFGSSFEAPAGFTLRRHMLLLGDLSLLFGGPSGQSLMLRQVYPAELALSRGSLEAWLESSRFRERRPYRWDDEALPYVVESGGVRLPGMARTGSNRLPFPLSWIRPRRCASVIVQDHRTGRLLAVRYEAPELADDEIVRNALLNMNRASPCAPEV